MCQLLLVLSVVNRTGDFVLFLARAAIHLKARLSCFICHFSVWEEEAVRKSVPLDAANQKSLHKPLGVLGPLTGDGQAAVFSKDHAVTWDPGMPTRRFSDFCAHLSHPENLKK